MCAVFRSILQCALIVIVSLIMFGNHGAKSADDLERFYGTWVTAIYNNNACKRIRGEVAGIAIFKDRYVPFLGGFCEDVNMFLRGGRLRISANCFSDEGGYSAITNEFELSEQNTLRVVEGFDQYSTPKMVYHRCLDCGQKVGHCVFGYVADGKSDKRKIKK